MDQETILLNSGQDQDVIPLAGVDEYLEGLLGDAASRPAVPALKVLDDPQGHKSVGVFIGTRQVGHLPAETGADLMATLQACEENSAIARVRGTLVTTDGQPGKVAVRVSLADSEHLLTDPGEPPPQTGVKSAPDSEVLSSSFEDAAALLDQTNDRDDLSSFARSESTNQESSAPELSAGVADDWPDWPPPGLKSESASPADQSDQVAEPLPTIDSSQAGIAPLSRSIFGPGPEPAPMAPEGKTTMPQPDDLSGETSPAAPEPLTQSAPSIQFQQPVQAGQSQAATQSGWLARSAPSAQAGVPAGPSADATQGQQSGYLGAQRSPGQASFGATASLGGTMALGSGLADGGGLAGTGIAGGGLAAGGGLTGIGGTKPTTGDDPVGSSAVDPNVSWQDFNTGPSKPMTAPPEGWTSTASTTQAVPTAKAPRQYNSVATWIIGVVAVAVVAAAGFLIWKTQFAPQTYTDAEYGYSFSYPHGWDTYDLTEDIAASTPLSMEQMPVDGVVVGTVDTNFWGTEEQFNAAMVAVVDTGVYTTESEIRYGIDEVRRELDQMQNLQVDGIHISMIEPAAYVQVGGLDGVSCAMRMEAFGVALVEKFCFLFQGTRMYILAGMCDGDSWPDSEGTLNSLIESFEPGPL